MILLDDLTSIDRDLQVQSIAHGVVLLEQLNPEYGLSVAASASSNTGDAVSRRLSRLRDQASAGWRCSHAWSRRNNIADDLRETVQRNRGARCSARGRYRRRHEHADRAQPGRAKSTLAAQFAAGRRNEASTRRSSSSTRVVRRCLALRRVAGQHPPVCRCSGISLQRIDPVELTPGQLTHAIRIAVEQQGAKVIVIDSLTAFERDA